MSAKRRSQRPKPKKNHGDTLFGIALFILVVGVAYVSVWYGLANGGQSQQPTTTRSVTLSGLPPGDPTLTTCVSEGNGIAMRLRVNLTVVIGGVPIKIPGRIGVTPQCLRPIHTLDSSGIVYVESPIVYPYTLGDFFAVWNQPFSKDRILFLRAGSGHQISMTVNGSPNSEYENHVLQEGERITIMYT